MRGMFVPALLLSALLLGACASSGVIDAAAVGSPLPTAPPTSAPTASPTPRPTPTPTPTPTPAPTPTPDPWAAMFHPGGAYVCVPDAAKGPWIYRDPGLSVEVLRTRGGPENRQYYVAEVYTRSNRFFGGFAYQTDKGYKTELPYRIARRYDAVLGLTADYYNHKSNRKGVIIRNGVVYHDKEKAPTLAVLPSGGLAVYEPGEITAQALLDMGVRDTFSFGPILVKDGAIHPSVKKHPLANYNYRAAVGQVEPGHYFVIVTLGSFKLTQLSQLFVDYGCTLAYNLDGGHSTCMIFLGEQLNRQYEDTKIKGQRQRTLPDLMMIGMQPAVPAVEDKVYCNGVDIFSRNKPKPTEGVLK